MPAPSPPPGPGTGHAGLPPLGRQPARQHGVQRLGAVGLGQIIIHAGGPAALGVALHGAGSQGDHRQVPLAAGFALAQGGSGRIAVEHRHLAIHQDEIDRLAGQAVERLLTVAGGEHFQPHAFQLGAGDNLVALVIFRDQHAAAQFRRCRRLRLAGGQRRPW